MTSKLLQGTAVALVVMAVPLFLITTNLRVIINSGWLYSFGFDRHRVAEYTGIQKPELMRVAREIKAYFNNSEELLDARAVVEGRDVPLFKEREITHMKDVKGLVKGLAFWQAVSFSVMVGVAVLGLIFLGPKRAIHLTVRGLFRGSVLTVVLLAAAGVGSLIGFDELFTRFHQLSFANDFWQLDPRFDNLVRIFPEGFFQDATLIVAGLTLGQAALTGLVTGAWLWRRRRARQQARVAALSS